MTQIGTRILFTVTLLLGVGLFVWAALTAPVVLWSDSHADLAWVRAGVGVFKPVPLPANGVLGHQPKPAYLLFLGAAMRIFPGLGEERSIVLTQSLLLALAIVWVALRLARRRGLIAGWALAVACFAFLRLRDASSTVMSEALATALVLAIAALLVEPPRWRGAGAFLGVLAGGAFLVRPNCGGAVFVLAAATFLTARESRRLLPFLAGFLILVLPFWYAGRGNAPGDPLHGLGYQMVEGSADYYWIPSIFPWPASSNPADFAREELRAAAGNWKKTLASPEPDRSRQISWRAVHGLLGIEYYDFRWSPRYAAAAIGSRVLSPFLILAAIAVLLLSPRRNPPKVAGLLLVFLLVGQNLLLGSNPRYVVPFFPAIFLFAIAGAGGFRGAARASAIFAALFAGLVFLAFWRREALDWQWGRIERAGVTLRQTIPRAALPSRVPAVLHLRIAPANPNSDVRLTVSAGRTILFSSPGGSRQPEISFALPPQIVDENRRGPVELAVTSSGSFGEESYILFPVIPPPWVASARRDGSGELSPSTGIRSGALDWWAHAGTP
jgi:hypothetical protein